MHSRDRPMDIEGQSGNHVAHGCTCGCSYHCNRQPVIAVGNFTYLQVVWHCSKAGSPKQDETRTTLDTRCPCLNMLAPNHPEGQMVSTIAFAMVAVRMGSKAFVRSSCTPAVCLCDCQRLCLAATGSRRG